MTLHVCEHQCHRACSFSMAYAKTEDADHPYSLISTILVKARVFLARLHEVQKSYCSHHGRTRSRSRSRSTLLKFSRSLYLGNHSSESIHTWIIGTQ